MALTKEQVQQRLLSGQQWFYFTGAESLRVTSRNSGTGVSVTVTGRFLSVDSVAPSDVSMPHTPNTDRSEASSQMVMGEGWLQSLTVIVAGGTPLYGQTFVRVDVVRGSGASATVLATLLQGPVTAGDRLAWPGSTMAGALERPGAFRVVTGSNPAAGAETLETVPTGARWRLLTWRTTLLADATVANRVPVLHIDDGSLTIWNTAASSAQTAGTSISHTFGLPGTSSNQQGLSMLSTPMVPPIMRAGFRIRTQTSSLQAGDDWGAPVMYVEEWLEG